jgi:hypothetical protein
MTAHPRERLKDEPPSTLQKHDRISMTLTEIAKSWIGPAKSTYNDTRKAAEKAYKKAKEVDQHTNPEEYPD